LIHVNVQPWQRWLKASKAEQPSHLTRLHPRRPEIPGADISAISLPGQGQLVAPMMPFERKMP
jgi:hypothetical protein